MIKKILMPLMASACALLPMASATASAPSVEHVEKKTPLQKVEAAIEQFARSDEDVFAEFKIFYALLEQGVREGKISQKEESRVLRALCFALEKHKDQVRSNPKKTPYIIHPIAVAERVMKIGGVYDRDILIAALLHDVMDDTGTSYDEIKKKFGAQVASYVEEMTDNKELALKERKKRQIMQAFHQSKGASVIKLADKLSNLSTLCEAPPSDWSRDRIDQYFQWAQSVVENLPEASPPLKDAVKQVIHKYWSSQEKK